MISKSVKRKRRQHRLFYEAVKRITVDVGPWSGCNADYTVRLRESDTHDYWWIAVYGQAQLPKALYQMHNTIREFLRYLNTGEAPKKLCFVVDEQGCGFECEYYVSSTSFHRQLCQRGITPCLI